MNNIIIALAVVVLVSSPAFSSEKCDAVSELRKLNFLNGDWNGSDGTFLSFSYSLKNHLLNTSIEDITAKNSYKGQGYLAYDCVKNNYTFFYVNNVGQVFHLQGEKKGGKLQTTWSTIAKSLKN